MNPPFNFITVVTELGLSVGDITMAPSSPGVYLLFSKNGSFIYVGKATDLKARLSQHFNKDTEENEEIRNHAAYAVWEPHKDVETAEKMEGAIYDNWISQTGFPPFANKVKPPKSTINERDLFTRKIKAIFESAYQNIG